MSPLTFAKKNAPFVFLAVLFIMGVFVGVMVGTAEKRDNNKNQNATPVRRAETIAAGSTTVEEISYTTFEDGTFQDFQANEDVVLSSDSAQACSGSYSIQIKKQGSFHHTTPFSVARFSDFRINFSYRPQNARGDSAFVVQYSESGGNSWEDLKRFQMNSIHPGGGWDNQCHDARIIFSQEVPSRDPASISSIQLRFLGDARRGRDEFNFDDILFEGITTLSDGIPSSTPSVTPSTVPSSTPSTAPSSTPSTAPSLEPSSTPSAVPTNLPSSQPSDIPSTIPSSLPSSFPTQFLDRSEICPLNKTFPAQKYHILPFPDTSGISYVEDDLSEISSLAISSLTDVHNNIYAYVASDKNQFSLKVVRFQTNDAQQVVQGTGETVAVYQLNNTNFTNSDWEDISLGPCSGAMEDTTVCIYVGNFGNNGRGGGYVQRRELEIYKFEEPSFSGTNSTPEAQNITVSTIVYNYSSFETDKYIDAEAMFVDWTGTHGEGKGDIYVVTKGTCGRGVGRIAAALHQGLEPGDEVNIGSIERVMKDPPVQGSETCQDGPFRLYQGADMSRDGKKIALITGLSPARVYFFPRETNQTVTQALEETPCDFVSSTSFGLVNEKKHEAVAFVDEEGTIFAETSECNGGGDCEVPIYFHTLVFDPPSESRTLFLNTDGWELITYDDFEDGFGNYMIAPNIADDPDAFVATTFPCKNSSAVQLRWDNGASSSIFHHTDQNCTAYSWLRVTFQFQLDADDRFDHMDALFLELSLDGGDDYYTVAVWAKDVDDIVDWGVCYQRTVELNAVDFGGRVKFGNAVRLRFRASANAMGDAVHIDDVTFEGHSGDLIIE